MWSMANEKQTAGAMFNSVTSGSKIIGKIIADTDVRLDGTLEGELQTAGKLVIGEKGFLKGTALCQNAELLGSLEGTLTVKQTLTLRGTSVVKGDIQTGVLIIEPNAKFNGNCIMGQPLDKNKVEAKSENK